MRKEISIILTAVLAIGLLGMLMTTTPVSAQGTYWDFEDHTNTHPHFRQLTSAEIEAELLAVNAAFMLNLGYTPRHLAYPYGDYGKNVADRARIKAVVSLYRDTGRVVWGKMETYPIADWYVHKAAQLKRATGWSKIKAWVDNAISTKALLHIFTHDVAARPSSYGCTPEKLGMLLDYLVTQQNAGNLAVMTIAEAYTSFDGTKAIVVVSFDDANESDYLVVYPMFTQRGLKGTSYIVTSFIGQPGCLNWEEIGKMSAGLP